MTREEVRVLFPILKAFGEGKIIQRRKVGEENWHDCTSDRLKFNTLYYEYRIKPNEVITDRKVKEKNINVPNIDTEEKREYRPFISITECWKEMQKHTPFSFVQPKDKYPFMYLSISCVYRSENFKEQPIIYIEGRGKVTLKEALKNYTFADGKPFGKKLPKKKNDIH